MIDGFSLEENERESIRLNKLLDDGIRDQLIKTYPSVRGVSVGLKITNDDIVWERCFQVYVDKKKIPSELGSAEMIPPVISGIKTDVHETSIASPAVVAQGGVKISNGIGLVDSNNGAVVTTSGTLGAVGRITGPCKCNVVGLTNWHVLYVGHRRIEVKKGTRIFQPNAQTNIYAHDATLGPDQETKDSDIGEVIDGVCNGTVDCALFEVNRSCSNCCGTEYHNIIDGLETISPLNFNGIRGNAIARAGDSVFFVGAVSGPSKGYVISESAPVDTPYPSIMICDSRVIPRSPVPGPNDNHVIHFTGQLKIRTDGAHPRNSNLTFRAPDDTIIRFSRFVSHGDSGALLLNSQNMAVGLIFATDGLLDDGSLPRPMDPDPPGVPPLPANPDKTLYGYANHISAVMDALHARGHKYEINYSQPSTGGSRGEPMIGFIEPDSEIFRDWKTRIEANPKTKAISDAVIRHRHEVLLLINHCRPVMVAWHRSKGPAFAATIANNIREGKFEYPASINGISANQLLLRIHDILLEHASSGLKEDLNEFSDIIMDAVNGRTNFEEVMVAMSTPVSI